MYGVEDKIFKPCKMTQAGKCRACVPGGLPVEDQAAMDMAAMAKGKDPYAQALLHGNKACFLPKHNELSLTKQKPLFFLVWRSFRGGFGLESV